MTQAHHAACFLRGDSIRPQLRRLLFHVVPHLVRQIAIDYLAMEECPKAQCDLSPEPHVLRLCP